MEEVQDAWRHSALAGWENPALDSPHPSPAPRTEVEPRVTNALGCDISAYQGVVDWPAVAASGRDFVYIKATEGVGYINPDLDAQYQGAIAAGLKVGLYAFADVTKGAAANADFFATQVNRLGATAGHLPPCLDLETGTGNLASWAQQFITELRAKTGCIRSMIYSNVSFMRNQILTSNWLDANIALWLADWSSPPGKPSLVNSQTAIHQYSSSGQISGIQGSVDLDLALWDLSTLIPGTPAPPVTTAPPATAPSDLTSTEDAALIAVYQQMSGSPTVGTWTGWPSWPGGSGRSLTMLDYLRQNDVAMCAALADIASLVTSVSALSAQVTALKAQLGTASPALTAADQQAIALAVVTMLTQRLAS